MPAVNPNHIDLSQQGIVSEKSTPDITAVIVDATGNPVPAGSLASLTLTYYSISDPSNPIINTRNSQNVLNANNVTVDASGNLRWSLQPADTAILDPTIPVGSVERHQALFIFTYSNTDGLRTGEVLIDRSIQVLPKLT